MAPLGETTTNAADTRDQDGNESRKGATAAEQRQRRLGGPRVSVAPATLRTIVVLLLITLMFTITSPDHTFWSRATLINVGLSAATIVVLACGATLVLVAGQLDLSIGSQLLVSATLGVAVINNVGGYEATWGQVAVGGLVMLLIGTGFGLLNGVLTVWLKVPSFIVTLGTGGAGLGVAQLLTAAGGSTSQPAPKVMVDFGLSRPGGIPGVIWVAAAVAVISGVVMAKTRFGLHVYATGSNTDAARRSGVRTTGVIVGVFCVMGLCSAIAGFIDLSRFTAVSTSAHQSDALTALAAIIIGGASLFGGRGTIFGTVLGVLVPVALLQGFVIQGVNPFWQNIAIGVVLIAAVALDRFDRSSLRRSLSRRTD